MRKIFHSVVFGIVMSLGACGADGNFTEHITGVPQWQDGMEPTTSSTEIKTMSVPIHHQTVIDPAGGGSSSCNDQNTKVQGLPPGDHQDLMLHPDDSRGCATFCAWFGICYCHTQQNDDPVFIDCQSVIHGELWDYITRPDGNRGWFHGKYVGCGNQFLSECPTTDL